VIEERDEMVVSRLKRNEVASSAYLRGRIEGAGPRRGVPGKHWRGQGRREVKQVRKVIDHVGQKRGCEYNREELSKAWLDQTEPGARQPQRKHNV
jgi:hypothetical protein